MIAIYKNIIIFHFIFSSNLIELIYEAIYLKKLLFFLQKINKSKNKHN